MDKNRETWEKFGECDPYYAVVTSAEFRASNLDEAAKEAFFELGRKHFEEIWTEFEAIAGPDFRPKKAVDYGCGVGRVLLPLAGCCGLAVGVDISRPMLDEAARNAAALGLQNVKFQDVVQFLSDEQETYDLVHTFIVIQHIPPATGYGIIERLVGRLSPGGVGMLHVTFKNSAPFLARMRSRLYRDVPGLHTLANKLRGLDDPFMPVYEYDLNNVLSLFEAKGCEVVKEKNTDHGFRGKMFYIIKAANG